MISRSLQQTVKKLPILGPVARWFRTKLIARNPGMFLPIHTESAKETKRHLGFGVEYVYHSQVEGDFAEFGTAAGISAVALAQSMLAAEEIVGPSSRKLMLFDSFEGLPESTSTPDLQSPQVKTGIWSPGSCKVLRKDQLLDAITSLSHLGIDRIETFEGWYKDTTPKLSPQARLALIHVDCDLYQSTMDALSPLFASGVVSEGAVILFDDWNCNRASPLCGERKAWSELVSQFSIISSDGGDYSWSGHKMFIHEYRRPANSSPPKVGATPNGSGSK